MTKKVAQPRTSKNKLERKANPSLERAAFRRGLAIRGEALELNDGIPGGATHQIVGHDAESLPIVKRRRFSLLGTLSGCRL